MQKIGLYKRFIAQTGAKQGSANDADVNKQLEKDLCAEFFKTDKIEEPPKEMDFRGVDVVVDGKTVQVKCHANRDLIFEDKKLNKNNIWIPGSIDRCSADLFLNVYPENGELKYDLFETEDVKQYLKTCRAFVKGEKAEQPPASFGAFEDYPSSYCKTKNGRGWIFIVRRRK